MKKQIKIKVLIFSICFILLSFLSPFEKAYAFDATMTLNEFVLSEPLKKDVAVLGLSAIVVGVTYNSWEQVVEMGTTIKDNLIAVGVDVAEIVQDTSVKFTSALKTAMSNAVNDFTRTFIEKGYTTVFEGEKALTGSLTNFYFEPINFVDGQLYYFKVHSEPNTFQVGVKPPMYLSMPGINLLSYTQPLTTKAIVSNDGSTVTIPFYINYTRDVNVVTGYVGSVSTKIYEISFGIDGETQVIDTSGMFQGVSGTLTGIQNAADNNVRDDEVITYSPDLNLSVATMESIGEIARTNTDGIVSTLTNVVDSVRALPTTITQSIAKIFIPTQSFSDLIPIFQSKIGIDLTFNTNFSDSPLVLDVPIGPSYTQQIILDNELFKVMRSYMVGFIYILFSFMFYKKITGVITNDN